VKSNSQSFLPKFLLGIIFLITGLNSMQVHAAKQAQTDCAIEYDWRQIPSENFVILYTANQVNLAQDINKIYISRLEEDWVKYEIAFSTDLVTPITIRLYPSTTEYYCLNALAPLISGGDFHSHIGTREIALIANEIRGSQIDQDNLTINALRHEIAVLFAEQITNGYAPPGLLEGLGGYFEDPEQTFINRFEEAGKISSPDRGWQRLWEEDVSSSNSLVFLQQTSTVAYLVDVFGWQYMVAFLQKIADLKGYRQALVEVYDVNLQDLQTHWMSYFPVYIQARWQANVIYNHDLSQYRVLIAEGAYADAASRLLAALPLIKLFESEEKLSEAESLLAQAEKGASAAELASESRQAILAGDYRRGYSKAEQGLALYAQLDDSRRTAELETYLDICREVLSLRSELEQLRGVGTPLDPVRTNRIISIGRRLNELGDKDGANEVQIVLLLLGTGQQVLVQWTTVIGLLVCIYLIWRRIVFVRGNYSSRVNLL
jgi:hypothetical protein